MSAIETQPLAGRSARARAPSSGALSRGERKPYRNSSIFTSNPVDQFKRKLPAPERKFGVVPDKGTYICLRVLEADNFETLSK